MPDTEHFDDTLNRLRRHIAPRSAKKTIDKSLGRLRGGLLWRSTGSRTRRSRFRQQRPNLRNCAKGSYSIPARPRGCTAETPCGRPAIYVSAESWARVAPASWFPLSLTATLRPYRAPPAGFSENWREAGTCRSEGPNPRGAGEGTWITWLPGKVRHFSSDP